MHSDTKPSMEDTWRPAELKRHIGGERPGGENVRRLNDNERKPRGGESVERRRRDPEKESRRERDEQKERGSTKERRHDEGKDRYAKLKDDSRDRRSDKDRDRRDERDKERRKERDRPIDDLRKRDREDKHERERDKERHRDKEKDRIRDRERQDGEERDKRREERDKERRREERDKDRRRGEQDREHRSEREKRRHEESGDGGRDRVEKYDREQRERHRERERPKDEREKERRERHGDRKHAEQKGEREQREEHKSHKEDRERRHKERGHDDQRQKHDTESRQHRDSKRPGEEERHHRGDKEQQQQEREKQKERRHREEEDFEKNHRERRRREEEGDGGDALRIHKDRSTSKKVTSEKSQRHETNKEKTEEFEIVSEHQTSIVKYMGDTEEPDVNDEDLDDQEYEDDFEDYEEDFEDIDPSEGEDEKEPEFPQLEEGEERDKLTTQKRKEIEAIQKAMNEENERVGTAQSGHSMKRGEEDIPKLSKGSERNRVSQRGRFIDFVAAKQREVSKKVATKQKKRSTELLRLIDLDFSMTASLLDLPPVNEYDMYIRTFGNANTKQAYVQCNEDNADRDVQTEEIEVCEKWTQHPPEYSGSCGDPNLSQEARDKNMNEINFDSQRLAAFLRSASQVMVVLLEENQAERKSLTKLRNQTDALSFSDGSSQLNTQLSFLYGRHISLVHFSQVQSHTMMSVHTPTTTPSAVRLDSCTLICIWNIWEPSRPQRILVYESEVQCCCFSPGKATLVFAGTSVGSVVLWDLREHAANHYCLKIGEDEWTFRQPTFSTDAVMASSGHLSPVSSVEVVPSTAAGGLRPEIPLLASEEESSGLSFQLASLDETGVLNFWVVVELPKASEAGSSTDLGLRPGGKVKLLHSSTLHTAERVSSRDAVKIGALQSLHLKFLPSDSNHFFIGTNMGLVRHGTSHGLKAPPKFYRFQEAGLRPVDVCSIHFSPFRPNLFLVGCGDGCIRLHAVSREQPVAEWSHSTAGERVVSVQWAQTRPTVFCVLDAASHLHIWDLLKNDTKPVITERISADRVTAMTVFGDSGKRNTYSGIALVHESGNIEMHYFTRDLTVSSCAEEEKLESLMTEAL